MQLISFRNAISHRTKVTLLGNFDTFDDKSTPPF